MGIQLSWCVVNSHDNTVRKFFFSLHMCSLLYLYCKSVQKVHILKGLPKCFVRWQCILSDCVFVISQISCFPKFYAIEDGLT